MKLEFISFFFLLLIYYMDMIFTDVFLQIV